MVSILIRNQVGICLIGAGRAGMIHAANFRSRIPRAQVVAIADPSREAALKACEELDVSVWYAGYREALQDRHVDAVVVVAPTVYHREIVVAAAKAGKHVLCEKPMAMGLHEAQAMFAAAAKHGVMLLEAFPYYFQPQTRDMLELLHSGTLGAVRTVQASFGFTLANMQTDIRIRPETGGGALLDAGSYPLSLIRLVMGEAPLRVTADSNWADSGVDISTTATLHYANGRSAQLSCAMNVAMHRRATIMATQGTIETEYLNHTGDGPGSPSGYLPSQLRVRRGVAGTLPFEEVRSATGSGFRFCAEAFARVVRAHDFAAIERAAAASLDNAVTLEAIAQSARLGKAVNLPKP